MPCPCCTPSWNCVCREPTDVRITISAPYSVNPNFGVDPIANAIGTYVLSRDRQADAAYNNGNAYWSLTPSGQSYSVDYPGNPSGPYGGWFGVPTGGVYAIVPVVCGRMFKNGVGTFDGVAFGGWDLHGKFLANRPAFGMFDVFTSRLGNAIFTYIPFPATPCSTSSQETGNATVLETINRYNSNGTIAQPPFSYSASSYDSATVTLQING